MSTATTETDALTMSLPRDALSCYALFCDVTRLPTWLKVIRSAVIYDTDRQGRPRSVAFLASLRRASVGYTCTYRYQTRGLRVAWSTPARTSIRVAGFARFRPTTEASCLMLYRLELDLGHAGLPAFDDDEYAAHAPATTLAGFRAYLLSETASG